jgi:hypothetical protein
MDEHIQGEIKQYSEENAIKVISQDNFLLHNYSEPLTKIEECKFTNNCTALGPNCLRYCAGPLEEKAKTIYMPVGGDKPQSGDPFLCETCLIEMLVGGVPQGLCIIARENEL